MKFSDVWIASGYSGGSRCSTPRFVNDTMVSLVIYLPIFLELVRATVSIG